MKKALSKLNNRVGATMIMALLLLLVATMASAVIISSAMTSAMNVKATEKDQQALLSVSSAAQYIKTEMVKAKVTRTFSDSNKITNDVDTACAFYPELQSAINELAKITEKEISGTTVFVKDSVYQDNPFYINIQADNTKLLPVKVIFEMDKTYDITVHLSIEDENYSECKTEMYIISKNTKTDDTHDTITWPSERIRIFRESDW